MNDEIELIHGSGNVFRDLDLPNPDLEQARAVLAAQVIAVLDRRALGVRAAARVTGVAASEYSRIRNAKLERFTLDRLISILGKLDHEVEIVLKVRAKDTAPPLVA